MCTDFAKSTVRLHPNVNPSAIRYGYSGRRTCLRSRSDHCQEAIKTTCMMISSIYGLCNVNQKKAGNQIVLKGNLQRSLQPIDRILQSSFNGWSAMPYRLDWLDQILRLLASSRPLLADHLPVRHWRIQKGCNVTATVLVMLLPRNLPLNDLSEA